MTLGRRIFFALCFSYYEPSNFSNLAKLVRISLLVFLSSCASSRTADIHSGHAGSTELSLAAPVVTLNDGNCLSFSTTIFSQDSVYASWYEEKPDTVLNKADIKEIRFKNRAKGLWLGFLIGITPGAIIYGTAGLHKNDSRLRNEGLWIGGIGALVGIGFSHDAAPTDTIFFIKTKN